MNLEPSHFSKKGEVYLEFIIGVDIGGTKTAIGVVDVYGEIITKSTLLTNQTLTPEQMIDNICNEIDKLLLQAELSIKDNKGIGIGAPGPLNSKKGEIICPPNLSNWKDVKIVEQIREYFHCPVFLENDANAAALGEKWVGAAKENNNFIYLTISTGIGAGIYINGELFVGCSGNAGDVGHIVVDPAYGTCNCGQKGCFEYVASGTAIARIGSEKIGRDLSTKEVFELYSSGNEKVVPFIEDVFRNIGVGCVTLINIFDPEKIIIGGGVAKVGEPLFGNVRDYVRQFALNTAGKTANIVPSKLGQDSGLIGAAALVIKYQQKN